MSAVGPDAFDYASEISFLEIRDKFPLIDPESLAPRDVLAILLHLFQPGFLDRADTNSETAWVNGYLYRLRSGTDAEGMEAFQVECIGSASIAWLNCVERCSIAWRRLTLNQIGGDPRVALIDPWAWDRPPGAEECCAGSTCQFPLLSISAGSAAVVNGIVHGPLEVGNSRSWSQRGRSTANP